MLETMTGPTLADSNPEDIKPSSHTRKHMRIYEDSGEEDNHDDGSDYQNRLNGRAVKRIRLARYVYHITPRPKTPSESSDGFSDQESNGENDGKSDSESDIDAEGGVKIGVESAGRHPSSPVSGLISRWNGLDANKDNTKAKVDPKRKDDCEADDDTKSNDNLKDEIKTMVESVAEGIAEAHGDCEINDEIEIDGEVGSVAEVESMAEVESVAEVESEFGSEDGIESVIDVNDRVEGGTKVDSEAGFESKDEAKARSASSSPRPPLNYVLRPQPPWNGIDFMDFKAKTKTKSISADSSVSMRNNHAREDTPTPEDSQYRKYFTSDDNDSTSDTHSSRYRDDTEPEDSSYFEEYSSRDGNSSSRDDGYSSWDRHYSTYSSRDGTYSSQNGSYSDTDDNSTTDGRSAPRPTRVAQRRPWRTHQKPKMVSQDTGNTKKKAGLNTDGKRSFRPSAGARSFESDPNPFMPNPFAYSYNSTLPFTSASNAGLKPPVDENPQSSQWHYQPPPPRPPPPPPPSPPPPRPPQHYGYQPSPLDQSGYQSQFPPHLQFPYQQMPPQQPYFPYQRQPSPIWPPSFDPTNPYHGPVPPPGPAGSAPATQIGQGYTPTPPAWTGSNEPTSFENTEGKTQYEGMGATKTRTAVSMSNLTVPHNPYAPRSINNGAIPTRPSSNTGTTKVGSYTEASKPMKPPLYGKLSQSEIRLIRVRPFTSSGNLEMSLVPTSLQNPPRYTALSYAWGEGTESVEVGVDGHVHQITSNLYEALRVLQERDRDVLCWADALAINQKDQEEVTEQVKLMRDIYRAAASVTVWLGNSSHDSDLALNLIRSLADHSRAGNENALRKLIMSPKSRQSFTALASLFERNYWRRLWIVQEILNAKHVNILCGSLSLPWETYERATNAIRRLSPLIDDTFASWLENGAKSLYVSSKSRMSYSEIFLQLGTAPFDEIKSLLWSNLGPDERSIALKFQIALCICRSRFATNERDKVYGLLGAVPEDVQKHIVPDYSITIKDVYTKAAEYIINGTKRLDIVGSAFHFPVHITPMGLPSWVPDWSHISPMTPINWPVGRFSAGSKLDADVALDSQHHRVLSIRAITIDKVARRGIPVGTTNTVDEFIMAFINWFAMLQGHVPEDATEDQKLRAEETFCRIVVLDNTHPLFQSPDVWRQVTLYLFASLARKNLPGLILDPRLAACADDDCVDLLGVSHNSVIQEHFSPGMTGRSFFLTKSGIMGMGSGYLAAGDTAVVPFGCSTPLLLRNDGDHGEYRLVSDAYLDNYMYGRAIEEYSKEKCKPERFTVH